jgi:hypothetical protein
MTAPEQPYPDMTAAIGEGAFEVSGGPTNAFGSELTTSAIDTITKGQQATGVVDGATAITKLNSYMTQLPAEALPLFGAAFGLTGPEVSSVMTFISGLTTPSSSPSTSTVLTNLSQYFAVLCDIFHETYEEGLSTDTPTAVGTNGKMTTWAAWNGLMALIGLASGTTPTTPLPSTGSTITGSTSTLTTWLNQISDVVNGLIVTPINTAVSEFQTWWNSLTSTVSGHGTSIGTLNTASALAASYAARQAANNTVLADWTHTTYAFGTFADNAATRVGGKMTYCGAWNDNILLLSQELGLSPAPILPADPNTSVTAAAAAASAASTAAGTAQSTASAAASAASAASTAAGTANTGLATLAGSGTIGTVAPAQINATIPATQLGTIPATQLGSVFSGANLGADLTSLLTSIGNALGVSGSKTPTTIASPLQSAVGGSMFRAFCSSPTNHPCPANGTNVFPLLLDTESYITSDYTWVPSTNTLTVTTKGLYTIKIGIAVTGSQGPNATNTLAPILYRNGAVARYGSGQYFHNASTSATQTPSTWIADSFTLECNPGDTITPGVYINTAFASWNFFGESTGAETYMEVALVRVDTTGI